MFNEGQGVRGKRSVSTIVTIESDRGPVCCVTIRSGGKASFLKNETRDAWDLDACMPRVTLRKMAWLGLALAWLPILLTCSSVCHFLRTERESVMCVKKKNPPCPRNKAGRAADTCCCPPLPHLYVSYSSSSPSYSWAPWGSLMT